VSNFVCILLGLLTLAMSAQQAFAKVDQFMIVPGQSLGTLKMPITEADVIRAYGRNAIPAELDVPAGEGEIQRGTVLYPCDPSREAELFYTDGDHGRVLSSIAIDMNSAPIACPANRIIDPLLKDKLPGDSVGPGTGYNSNVRQAWIESLGDKAAPKHSSSSLWRLSNGVSVDMTTNQLQKLNGKPFTIFPGEGDTPGSLVWDGGRLDDAAPYVCEKWRAHLFSIRDISENSLKSDDPRVVKANRQLDYIDIAFADPDFSTRCSK
jgi:hypothetical protein